MNKLFFRLISLLASVLITYPAAALPAPTSTSPYYTDIANSYVYDQVTEDMLFLNGFLCLMSGMAPSLMVNNGDYIALIDAQSCFTSGSGGKSSNKGKQYVPVQVNSSRESNIKPMVVKMWFDGFDANVPLVASASQAPTKAFPYGFFRMDGCVKLSSQQSCDGMIGYIDASKSGLAFYYLWKDTVTLGNFAELSLQLSSSSSANSGSGIVVTNNKNNNVLTTEAILFAYSPDYFYRNNGTLDKCFNRSLNYAQESAWRYGLYDAVTGEHLAHPSGFPIEYTYSSANTSGTGTVGTTYNGYVSYYGLSMQYGTSAQIKVPTGETVNQIIYDGTSPPPKKPYTLINSGGKLTKYSTQSITLSALNKLPIWYWAYTGIPATTINQISGLAAPSITTMAGNKWYEIYWDDTNKYFVVSGQVGNSGYMEPLPVPGYLTNAAMIATDIYASGLSGWSQLLGGSFTIKRSAFVSLDTTRSTTPVITQTQNVVYPQDFAAINAASAGGLKCIGDCPTSTTANAFTGTGWGPFLNLANQNYSLDPATGNLLDGAPVSGNPSGNPVVKTTASAIYSGKLVTGTDMAYILSQKPSCGSVPCYTQGDIDLLSNRSANYSYYVWQTSSDYWDQMAFLTDQATNKQVTFYPPLPVSFAVPNTSTYGSLAGSTVSLQYGDFGDLWGIPNKCVDLTNNAECVFTAVAPSTYTTSSANQHWAPRFSIPFNTTDGFVTAGSTQGPIAQGTQYLVKALDKEIRLAEVPIVVCQALGLTKPITIAKLPSYTDWIDPRPLLGSKPALNPMPAPSVIDGVKQY